MKVIDPLYREDYTVLDTNLLVIWPEWTGGAYLAGDTVSYTDDRVYQAVQAHGPGGVAPGTDPLFWLDSGVTNPYKTLDGIINSTSTHATDITITLALADLTDSVAFLNVNGVSSITLVMEDTVGVEIYNNTVDLYDAPSGFYTNETILLDLPLYQQSIAYITFTGTNGPNGSSVGNIIFGRLIDLGYSEYGASASIVDYSTKETDTFGNFTVINRAFSKQLQVAVVMPAGRFDQVYKLLTKIRSKPVVWITTDNTKYSTILIVYGFYKDFTIGIPNCEYLDLNLNIEGLSEGSLTEGDLWPADIWRFAIPSPAYWVRETIATGNMAGSWDDVTVFTEETGLLTDSLGRKYFIVDGVRYTSSLAIQGQG